MSCPNANSPIDISSQKVSGKCDLKCEYNFKYPNSSCVATNRKNYISISYDSFSSAPVKYNTIDYNVSEIRIYSPSMHSFDGQKTSAELVIIHISNKGTLPLLVCVPITNNNSRSSSSNILSTIINNISLNAPSDGESTSVSLNDFSLDDFVPKKPFFSYTAIQPYQPCVGNVNFIVFSPKFSECYISNDSLGKLQKVIVSNNFSSKKGPLLFINEKGPDQNTYNDDIYIDCKPISKSDEQINVPQNNSNSFNTNLTWSSISQNPLFQIIMGSLIFIFIIFIFSMLLKIMSGGSIEFSKPKNNTNTKS